MKKGFTDIEVSKIVKANWNYKTENKILTEKLTENFKRNGQVENIIVRELDTGFYEVVNGNHRLDVMSTLKIKQAHIFNLGKISEATAQRIAIETNETKFETDDFKVGKLLTSLAEEFSIKDLEKTMPYTNDQLKEMQELVNLDWEQINETTSLDDPDYNEKYISLNFHIPETTFKQWEKLNKKMEKIIGYKNQNKVFEFMITETNNIPIESIK